MKVVHVYGFCHSDDFSKVRSKILDLLKNIGKLQICSEYRFGARTLDYWKEYATLETTPNYIIGVDSDYRKLTDWERQTIKSYNVPYRLIKI